VYPFSLNGFEPTNALLFLPYWHKYYYTAHTKKKLATRSTQHFAGVVDVVLTHTQLETKKIVYFFYMRTVYSLPDPLPLKRGIWDLLRSSLKTSTFVTQYCPKYFHYLFRFSNVKKESDPSFLCCVRKKYNEVEKKENAQKYTKYMPLWIELLFFVQYWQ